MPRNLFKIYDGRNYFLQWDTEQKLIVLDPTIKEVHFSNHDMKHAITKDVIVDKDGVRVCPIPDALLMLPKNLIASANVTDEDGVQRFRSVKFGVRPRQIPSDYIVTEDFYFEDFNTRLRFLEEIVADGCLIHRFESIEEAEQWAQNSKEIGSVISVQTADGWMTYTVEKDLSVKPVCDCDEDALIRAIDALKNMIGDSPVNEQIQSVIAALDLSNTYEQKGAADQALTQAKAYADSLSKNYDKAGSADAVKSQLDAEIERARNEEAALSRDIRATDKKVDNVQESLDAEIARATNEDKVLNEVYRQVNDKVVAMQSTLDEEVERATTEDAALNIAFRQLNDRVTDVQDNLSIRIDGIEMSIDDKINEAVNKIKDNPDEALNSINEVVEWVKKNTTSLKITTIDLLAANWVGDTSPYSQVVTVNGATRNSKVDLQPTATQIAILQDAEVSLTTENTDGVVTVYAIGDKITEDMTMQVAISEVTVT